MKTLILSCAASIFVLMYPIHAKTVAQPENYMFTPPEITPEQRSKMSAECLQIINTCMYKTCGNDSAVWNECFNKCWRNDSKGDSDTPPVLAKCIHGANKNNKISPGQSLIIAYFNGITFDLGCDNNSNGIGF